MPPDVATPHYQLEINIITGLFGFVLGVVANAITFYFFLNPDRRVRLLDREAKRLSCWKTMRELNADSSRETVLSQEQINALDQRFREDVQKSVDVMMGWEEKAEKVAWFAVFAVVVATLLLVFVAGNFLPSFPPSEMSGAASGELGIWGAFLMAVYVIYKMVRDRAVRLMREYSGKYNHWMFFYK